MLSSVLSAVSHAFFFSHYRCTGWIQRDYLCLWADLVWENVHHGGTVLLNNLWVNLLLCRHTDAHMHYFYIQRLRPCLPACRAQLPPSLPLLPISFYEPSAAGILLYYTLREKKTCFFISQKIACSATTALSSHFIPGSAFILPLCTLSAHLFLLTGEPPRSRRNGNHPPDLRGHIRTHICHG